MKFEQATFKIVGMEPGLLTHNPQSMGMPNQGAKTKKIPKPEEEAETGLYLDEEGHFCFHKIGFRSSLLNSLSYKKVGKKAANVVFAAAVFVDEELIVLRDPDTWEPLTEYLIDTRRAMVVGRGIMRSRPKFPRWGCDLEYKVNTDLVTVEQVLEEQIEAGQIIGVGDFRPAKKGFFGRYIVELIEPELAEQDESSAEK